MLDDLFNMLFLILLLYRDGHSLTIGILDISGFENLRLNSFEQLLINVTNERLHQYFQQQIFVTERADYDREGVAYQDIAFSSNSDVLELLFQVTATDNTFVHIASRTRAGHSFTVLRRLEEFHNW